MNGVDPESTGSLEEQVAELRARVRLLERTIRAYGFVPQNEDASPAQAAVSAVLPPPAPIEATPALPQTRKDRGSLESRIGSQWFNRIGILAGLIGMALFLKVGHRQSLDRAPGQSAGRADRRCRAHRMVGSEFVAADIPAFPPR